MTPSILGWMCIKQRSLSPFWIPPGKLVMEAILETQTSRVQDNFRVADHPELALLSFAS